MKKGQTAEFEAVALLKEDVRKVDLGKLLPNPWQVERRDGPEALQELADSILQHGLIETPVGRMDKELNVQLASGHRRLAAHRLLLKQGHPEFSVMRVRIANLSDEQMADIVIQENQKRQDLDPIAEAKLYQRYLKDFGVTQTELARRIGCSQAQVANTLRLLELPGEAQELLISRDITPRHGRELLRASLSPEVQRNALSQLKKEGCSVEHLARDIDSDLRAKSMPLGNEDVWKGRPVFDLEACKGCDKRVMLPGYSGEKKAPFCLDQKCWKKKQSEAEDKEAKKLKEEMGKKGTAAVHTDLKNGTYNKLDNWNNSQIDNPKECLACKDRHYIKGFDKSLVPICINLSCFAKKKGLKTKHENEMKRQAFDKQTARIEAALKARGTPGSRLCSLLTLEVLLRQAYNREVTSWFNKEYAPGEKKTADIADRLATVLKGKTDLELLAMLPRVAFEVLRDQLSQRKDRLNFYLREMEGGPQEVDIEVLDGIPGKATMKLAISDIFEVRCINNDEGKGDKFSISYGSDGSSGSAPISEETAEELSCLNFFHKVKQEASPQMEFNCR